jgi:hypothetical protein
MCKKPFSPFSFSSGESRQRLTSSQLFPFESQSLGHFLRATFPRYSISKWKQTRLILCRADRTALLLRIRTVPIICSQTDPSFPGVQVPAMAAWSGSRLSLEALSSQWKHFLFAVFAFPHPLRQFRKEASAGAKGFRRWPSKPAPRFRR